MSGLEQCPWVDSNPGRAGSRRRRSANSTKLAEMMRSVGCAYRDGGSQIEVSGRGPVSFEEMNKKDALTSKV